MQLQNRETLRTAMNQLGSKRIPFLFVLDFKGDSGVVVKLSDLSQTAISCVIKGKQYGKVVSPSFNHASLTPQPIAEADYTNKFHEVQQQILHGNSFLLNLTFPTYVGRDLSLDTIFCQASAPYRLLVKDEFLCYSPESFVTISDNKINTYPMKGTIDGRLPHAEQLLLNDEKELFEHYTIVDLMRNDLAMVSEHVKVEQFRYMEAIETSRGTILQTSSQISGELPTDWHSHFGTLLLKLLPAGSISGAPKQKTVEIIEQVEITSRGFYTGVMGVFDGDSVDSAVLIRFLRRDTDGRFYYHSGGGITCRSEASAEYNELLAKIYVPTL